MKDTSLSRDIAAWALDLDYRKAPVAVRDALATCLLYNLTMGVAVDAVGDPMGRVLSTIATEPGRSRLLNGGSRRSVRDAAFINAGLITARGQNDTYPDTVTHIGCVVIPVVLALADEYGCGLDDILSALLTGYEVIPRIAHGISEHSSQRGFRATSIYGVIGAAVAGSRLLNLTTNETANAISIATQSASGILQTWVDGSDEWRLQIAKASRNAIEAVLLARLGLNGSPHALEGTSGFVRAFAHGSLHFETDGWRLPHMTFKPYPGCAFNQGPVHGLRQCIARHEINLKEIRRVGITMHPADAGYPGIGQYGPFTSSSGAIMSLPFMLAATIRDSLPKVAHFDREYGSGGLHEISRMIELHASPDVRRWNCIVEATLSGGASHTLAFAEPRPFSFTWDEVVEILHGVVAEWPAPDREEKFRILADTVRNVHDLGDYERLASVAFGLNRSGAEVPAAP